MLPVISVDNPIVKYAVLVVRAAGNCSDYVVTTVCLTGVGLSTVACIYPSCIVVLECNRLSAFDKAANRAFVLSSFSVCFGCTVRSNCSGFFNHIMCCRRLNYLIFLSYFITAGALFAIRPTCDAASANSGNAINNYEHIFGVVIGIERSFSCLLENRTATFSITVNLGGKTLFRAGSFLSGNSYFVVTESRNNTCFFNSCVTVTAVSATGVTGVGTSGLGAVDINSVMSIRNVGSSSAEPVRLQ